MNLARGHRRGYLNLELRLLHHECCDGLIQIGAKVMRPLPHFNFINLPGHLGNSPEDGGLTEYAAPVMPLDKEHLMQSGYPMLILGPLKQSALRRPVIRATDSLARARLMFGGGHGPVAAGDAEATARVITAIYSQMCSFYGTAYLFPIMEALGEMLTLTAPSQPPTLPYDESRPCDLGVDVSFWVGIERINSAAKMFDRELWAEQRAGSARVWEILLQSRSHLSLNSAREKRVRFFRDLEMKGEAAVLRALDAISTHIQWILVQGGEAMLATGGARLLHNLTTGHGGVSEMLLIDDICVSL